MVSVLSSCSIEAGFKSQVVSIHDFRSRGPDFWLALVLSVQKKQV